MCISQTYYTINYLDCFILYRNFFAFAVCDLGILFKKVPKPRSWNFLPVFSFIVLQFQVFHLFKPFIDLYLCEISLIYSFTIECNFLSIIYWKNYASLYHFPVIFVKIQLNINAWIYPWAYYSVTFVYYFAFVVASICLYSMLFCLYRCVDF